MAVYVSHKRSALVLGVALLALDTSVPLFAAEAVQTDTAGLNDDIERLSIHYRQAYRGNVPATELPQAITVLDEQLIKDTGLTRFQDLLDYSASVARQNNGGGLWDSFSLRGFPGNENMPSGYLINGFNGGRGFSGHRDLSNVAYVEILKGPGSAALWTLGAWRDCEYCDQKAAVRGAMLFKSLRREF